MGEESLKAESYSRLGREDVNSQPGHFIGLQSMAQSSQQCTLDKELTSKSTSQV